MKPRSKPYKTSPAPAQPATIARVMDETVRLFHRLKASAEEVHGGGELTAALRGVLRGLMLGGPQTVPQMARTRPVSRQFMQSLVNQLLAAGLVELRENPAHKRSRLVALTREGRSRIESMLRREAALFRAYRYDVPESDLLRTVEILRSLREALESPAFRALLRTENSSRTGKQGKEKA